VQLLEGWESRQTIPRWTPWWDLLRWEVEQPSRRFAVPHGELRTAAGELLWSSLQTQLPKETRTSFSLSKLRFSVQTQGLLNIFNPALDGH